MEFGADMQHLMNLNDNILYKAIAGLALDDFHRQPAPGANSIAWLLWHLARVEDRSAAAITNGQQLWLAEGWHKKFNRPADPNDRGVGDTPEKVDAFRVPSVELLVGYRKAVRAYLDSAVAKLTSADLERMIPDFKGTGLHPLYLRINVQMLESLQHAGQIAYLRGLYKGQLWLGG